MLALSWCVYLWKIFSKAPHTYVHSKFEPYLDILPTRLRIRLTRFRTSNHRLPIETGRWRKRLRGERICPHCSNNSIGDEFHNLFECRYFNKSRRTLIEPRFYTNPSVFKSTFLLNSTLPQTLLNLSKFVNIVMKSYDWDIVVYIKYINLYWLSYII